jgi:hypothetical protein
VDQNRKTRWQRFGAAGFFSRAKNLICLKRSYASERVNYSFHMVLMNGH